MPPSGTGPARSAGPSGLMIRRWASGPPPSVSAPSGLRIRRRAFGPPPSVSAPGTPGPQTPDARYCRPPTWVSAPTSGGRTGAPAPSTSAFLWLPAHTRRLRWHLISLAAGRPPPPPPRDAYDLTGRRLRQGHRQCPASSLRNRHLSGSGGVVAGPLLR